MLQRSKKRLVRFGLFELDLDAGELRKQGVRLQLQPKPLQMLEMLLERPGDIVTREELQRRLWEGDTFVDYESGLNTAANRLRLKLGDSAERPQPSLVTFVPDLEMVPATAMHRGIGIRSHKEILRRSEKGSATLDWLAEQIKSRSETHRQNYQFLAGARSLLRLKQKLGHMSEASRISFAGILEQKISWFLVHSGFTRSAISHASLALWLLQTAYYRLGRKDDVREFIKASLIASHANLLAGRPVAALQLLEIMRDASETIDAPLGSDYYRQRGVALFQLGSKHDGDTKTAFEKSEQQMRRLGEGSDAQAVMSGSRHVALLGKPDWERSLEVLEAVSKTFPDDSLEASMTRHWAAACGLLADSSTIRQQARGLVEENRPTATRFGHQATISKLLSITPELGLGKGLEAIWIRKTLYQNAFRFK